MRNYAPKWLDVNELYFYGSFAPDYYELPPPKGLAFCARPPSCGSASTVDLHLAGGAFFDFILIYRY